MNSSIVLGIIWHLIGAASAACFYAPFKQVKHWSWETMWSLGGFFSWIILPWAVSYVLLPDFWAYYGSFSFATLLPIFLFGAMWGIGNINYGLTMRYLGMSMGIGIAIGITLIIGTLMTPVLQGKIGMLFGTTGGQLTLLGVFVAVIGVAIVSYAGFLKEKALGIKAEEFNLRKGLILAIMCGIFSAGMSFAMSAAVPMHEAARELGIDPLYVALPSYVVIMGGGAVVNLGFCFIRLATRKTISLRADMSVAKSLLLTNAVFSIIGGVMWYLQFFFYAWGHASIPAEYDYMSWMLHMSFYVLCGGIVGLVLKEWLGVGKKPVRVLCIGALVIILAANIVGLGMAL
ncbi:MULTISPECIES: L-rhamnose/proton symporter RhaT [Rahnella]|jgi:L-rhamnose-H+ transport protein|uniref:L-rhamnose/proton symporter RhaT n=1 Tax=Rahnella TaxID=34037 RepID=UPI001297E546|nr:MULTISPECIES: L-rhamnose/proton symporter RhaT [Rahnella]MBU9843313.1 L-rhamnose/proton symporter RhaT [Rahnella aceris]MQB55150.1 L-rhamnose/proton symporter RhaT [Rahnella sp. RcJ3]